MKLENLSAQELQCLLDDSHIIEKDAYGVKVAVLPDGTFIKILRRKKFWKVNEAEKIKRFCINAEELQRRAVPTLAPLRMLRIAEQKKTAVIYKPLEGKPLRKALMEMDAAQIHSTISRLAVFIHALHQSGIYFRSLHADNILLMNNYEFGLIDILDMKFSRQALSIIKRARNFRHFFRLRNLADWHTLLVENYLEVAGFSNWKSAWFRRQLKHAM